MKKVKILTLSEKKQLDSFYCSNQWETLSKVLRNQKDNIKNMAILSDTIETLSFHKGQLQQIIWLENQLFLNHKEIKKEIEKGEKNAKEKSSKKG